MILKAAWIRQALSQVLQALLPDCTNGALFPDCLTVPAQAMPAQLSDVP